MTAWVTRRMRRLPRRSLSAPPTAEKSRMGVNWSAFTSPSWSGDPVSSSTSHHSPAPAPRPPPPPRGAGAGGRLFFGGGGGGGPLLPARESFLGVGLVGGGF